MCTNHFGNTTSQEVPYDNTTIVTTYGQQRAMPVECTSQCHADTIQRAIGVLHTQKTIYQEPTFNNVKTLR